MSKIARKKTILISAALIIALSFTMLVASMPQAEALSNTPVVYISTHPDDVDIALSGSLYKYHLGVNPILVILVTDGAADSGEYNLEKPTSCGGTLGLLRVCDGTTTQKWYTPGTNPHTITRTFYSLDLSKHRSGIAGWSYYGNACNLIYQIGGYRYTNRFGTTSRDFYSRWSLTGVTVTAVAYSYVLGGRTYCAGYPDGSLGRYENYYGSNLASNIASTINDWVALYGYSKSVLYINSMTPSSVKIGSTYYTVPACVNYRNENVAGERQSVEHPDHCATGNAVQNATQILRKRDGFSAVYVSWSAVYGYNFHSDTEAGCTCNGQISNDTYSSTLVTKVDTLVTSLWESDYYVYGVSQHWKGYYNWHQAAPPYVTTIPNGFLGFRVEADVSY